MYSMATHCTRIAPRNRSTMQRSSLVLPSSISTTTMAWIVRQNTLAPCLWSRYPLGRASTMLLLDTDTPFVWCCSVQWLWWHPTRPSRSYHSHTKLASVGSTDSSLLVVSDPVARPRVAAGTRIPCAEVHWYTLAQLLRICLAPSVFSIVATQHTNAINQSVSQSKANRYLLVHTTGNV
jgi:hypothetical protein